MKDEHLDYLLTLDEQRALLNIARTSVEWAVQGGEKPNFEYDFPVFREKRGAFVTISKDEQLRGCIGFVLAVKPLAETVSEMAIAAGKRDPRFPPVSELELPKLNFEISVLSPLREIQDISLIKVGLHGIYIKKGINSGLLLPQVAEKYNWDRHEFLNQTCLKAGLTSSAWQDHETCIEMFSAQVFADGDALRD